MKLRELKPGEEFTLEPTKPGDYANPKRVMVALEQHQTPQHGRIHGTRAPGETSEEVKEKIITELKHAALIGALLFIGSGMFEACILKVIEAIGL